ncbi:hypothetical protein ACFO3O_20855 [Dokdonia ponticola]|uniref:Uncharacterized protein n=1 Tax=Dokdonia ponticola TaxID=2041041 RepID=A0ABV9I2G5_9FLAO
MIKNVKLLRARIFLVLTAMTLFICCQKDDEPSTHLGRHLHEQLQTTTTVSLDEIPKVAEYLSTLGDHRGHFTIEKSVGGSNRSSEPDLVIGTLQTSEIIQVTDQYNQKNHTFLLTSIENTNTTVKSTFNLVVQESSSGLFSYITEYRPDEDWIPNYRDSQDFSTFSGEIIHYSITGRYIAKLSLMNGIAINGETRSPCSDDGEPSGGGGNEGNPSPGESGPGDGDGGGNGDNPPPDPDVSADLKWLCVWRQFLHNEPSECNNPSMGGSWVIVITYGDKSVEDTVRCPDDLPELPEMCNDGNGDPCDCAPDGVTCMEEEPEEEPEDTETNETVGVIFDLGLNRDCRKLENLGNSPSFQQRMQELIANNSGNTEIAYYGRNDDNDNMNYSDMDRFESQEGKKEINAPTPQDPVDSYIHNHFNDGNGTLSIFSPGDFYALYTLYSQGRIANTSDFVMVMTSPGISNSPDDDTLYAITFSSENDFAETGSFLLSNLDITENIFRKSGLLANVDPEIAERQMTQIFKDNNLGLTLFRGNVNDLNDWTRVRRKNNNDFSESNCN